MAAADNTFDPEIIAFALQYGMHPPFRGRDIKSRRVLEIGKSYYWQIRAIPRELVPQSFWDWIAREGLEEYNSILVNIYENKSDNIGWHSDRTCNLVEGRVVSYSFCINPGDEDKVLAVMDFKGPDKKITKHELKHGSRVEFDAIEDEKNEIQHRVSKTLFPRLNITLRKVKA